MSINAVFKELCLNCEKDISIDRLEMGLLCINCLPEVKKESDYIKNASSFKKRNIKF